MFEAVAVGNDDGPTFRPVSHLDLEPGDDADRIICSASGARALITLPKAKQAVAIDLSRPESPRLAGRAELSDARTPRVSLSPDGDWILMPTTNEAESVAFGLVEALDRPQPYSSDAGYLLCTVPDESVMELVQTSPQRILGRFPLKGPLNLGGTRPSGLALSIDRGLIAVVTKSGTVHLVAIQSRIGPTPPQPEKHIAASSTPRRN